MTSNRQEEQKETNIFIGGQKFEDIKESDTLDLYKCYVALNGQLVGCQVDYSKDPGKDIPGLPEEAVFINQYMLNGTPVLEYSMPSLRKKKWKRKNSKRHQMRKTKLLKRFRKGAVRITGGRLSLQRYNSGARIGHMNALRLFERMWLQGDPRRQAMAGQTIYNAVFNRKVMQRGRWEARRIEATTYLAIGQMMVEQQAKLPLDGLQEDNQLAGGLQYLYKFKNGYGANVAWNRMTNGNQQGLWEVGFVKWQGDKWELVHYEPFEDSVSDGMTLEEVKKTLADMKAL